jgi:hypothetical protein
MSSGNVSGYQGKGVEVVSNGSEVFVKIYTASALSEGAVYQLTYKYDSTIGLYAGVVASATVATATAIVCVVQNHLKGVSGIAAAKWGFVQIAGVVEYCTTVGTTAANDQMRAHNGAATLEPVSTGVTVGGAAIGVSCCGIAISNVTTNVWKVFLLGRQTSIAA